MEKEYRKGAEERIKGMCCCNKLPIRNIRLSQKHEFVIALNIKALHDKKVIVIDALIKEKSGSKNYTPDASNIHLNPRNGSFSQVGEVVVMHTLISLLVSGLYDLSL